MAHENHVYVATLRAVYRAEDDVEAIMIADQIKVNGEADLEPEDGDTLDVTQVTQNTAVLSAEETVILLRRARNALIRTRAAALVDCARELDKSIHLLSSRLEHDADIALSGYDYGTFVDVMKEVLGGSNPVHI